ncbi:pre-rRNA processing and 40S ribosomal subunit assembly [Madurella fahalii]|uniref:Pre-rRNA processing and 40S ribosomal subunit assembly n=1 Tax=Madurella fahalii TaxID=1157608 RepID=A0ABQ0GRZ3_9PEZI
MPSLLGKRKSRSADGDSGALTDAQELLKRHFEARFKPLAVAPCAAPPKPVAGRDGRGSGASGGSQRDDDSEPGTDQSESEWDGVSDGGDDEDGDGSGTHSVEVVDHSSTGKAAATSTMNKRELKAYLAQSSRPPSHSHTSASAAQMVINAKKMPSSEDQPEDSAAFLANDLALQRLIAESHILSAAGGNASHWQSQHAASTASNTRAFSAGRTAHKTTDMRVQALGAKESILTQAKMPMTMRKGIVTTAASKEEKRRREARENGIILEREVKKVKTKKKGRGDRPVDLPAVGRMRGAELRVSAREARAIAASGRGAGGKGKMKRRR